MTEGPARFFEDAVYEHLRSVFTGVRRNVRLGDTTAESMIVDFSVDSDSGRMLLFEAKWFGESRPATTSLFLSMAGLQDQFKSYYPARSATLSLITNCEFSDRVKNSFIRAQLPVCVLGTTPEETVLRLRNAFQTVGIQVPELDSEVHFSTGIMRRCFLVHSALQDQVMRRAEGQMEAALALAGYSTIRLTNLDLNYVLSQLLEFIKAADLVVVDISVPDPNVFYEAGLAHSLGKEVIFISHKSEVPIDIASNRIIFYDPTDRGIELLRDNLLERLKLIENRNLP